MDKGKLTELKERVEAATVPDRALDRDIQKALDIGPTSFTQDEFNHWPLHVTASVDAALALVERMLPVGTNMDLKLQVGGRYFHVEAEVDDGDGNDVTAYNHPSLPLAILDAMVLALINQHEAT